MFFKNIFRLAVILFLFFVVSSFVSADDVDFKTYRDEYKSYETVQVNITIENITLSKDLELSNFVLLDKNNNSISIVKNKIKVNNYNYLFYFDLPSLVQDTYQIGLKNVFYTKNGISKTGEFFSDLVIIEGDSDIVSLRPAFVYSKILTSQEAPFTLTLNNKGKNRIDILLEKEGDFFSFQQDSFSLSPGSTKNVNVFTSLYNKKGKSFDGLIKVNYADNYDIPFNVVRTDYFENITENNITSVNTSSDITGGIRLATLSDKDLETLSINLKVGERYPPGRLAVNNIAGVDLHNIQYSLTGDIIGMLNLDKTSDELLAADGKLYLSLELNNDYNFQDGNYTGFLNILSSEGASYSLPISIKVFGSKPQVNTTVGTTNQTTNNITEPIGTIIEVNKPLNPLVYLLIFIILIIIVLFILYRKGKKKKKEFETFIDKIKVE